MNKISRHRAELTFFPQHFLDILKKALTKMIANSSVFENFLWLLLHYKKLCSYSITQQVDLKTGRLRLCESQASFAVSLEDFLDRVDVGGTAQIDS